MLQEKMRFCIFTSLSGKNFKSSIFPVIKQQFRMPEKQKNCEKFFGLISSAMRLWHEKIKNFFLNFHVNFEILNQRGDGVSN